MGDSCCLHGLTGSRWYFRVYMVAPRSRQLNGVQGIFTWGKGLFTWGLSVFYMGIVLSTMQTGFSWEKEPSPM